MNKLVVLFSVFVIFAIVVMSSFVLMSQPQVELKNFGQASNFKLLDENNNTVTLDNYTGKVLLIDFIYSHCNDMCPAETANLNNLKAKLNNGGYNENHFHFISISFDWKFDNATTMKAYGQDRAVGQFQYWSFLSGNEQEIKTVTSDYGVYSAYLNQTNSTIPIMTATPLANNTITYMEHMMVLTIVDVHGVRRAVHVGMDWPFNDVYKEVKSLIDSAKF